jgi:hypothetical protein
LAELGHISEETSHYARIGVGVVFLLAAAWVLRRDYKPFLVNLREGLRTPWAELAQEEAV